MRRLLCVLTLAGIALALPLRGVSASPPSAEEFYARAVEQMRHHPDPAFATYDASISGLNCRVAAGGMDCTLGRSTAESEKPFPVDLRQSDGRVAINPQERPIVFGDSTFLNPTWPGVDAIIRRGFTGMGGTASPSPTPVQSSSALPVIAVVSTFSVERYDVYDAGCCDLRDWRSRPRGAFDRATRRATLPVDRCDDRFENRRPLCRAFRRQSTWGRRTGWSNRRHYTRS